MDSIATEYHVCKGSVCLSIQGVENTLAPDGSFALTGKQQLKRKSQSFQYVVVDGTETRYTAPKRTKKLLFRNKNGTRYRRRSSLRGILCTSSMYRTPSGEHDCKVYTDTMGKGINNSIPLDADLAYRSGYLRRFARTDKQMLRICRAGKMCRNEAWEASAMQLPRRPSRMEAKPATAGVA